jgi:hypothetical protein
MSTTYCAGPLGLDTSARIALALDRSAGRALVSGAGNLHTTGLILALDFG